MSIRLRLAIWYGALSAIVVGMVCAYAYFVHVRTHYDEFDEMLQSRTEHLGRMLADARTPVMRHGVLAMAAPLGVAVRVFDPSGTTILEEANAHQIPSLTPRDVLRQPAPRLYSSLTARVPIAHGRMPSTGTFGVTAPPSRWRAYVIAAPTGNAIMGLASVAAVDASVRRYRRFLFLLGVGGVSGTFVVGWLIARHALLPVAKLTRTARQIAAARVPTHRVPIERERDELGQLATTFNEMLASLEAAQTAQQRFVSDASHEMRAPLTVIQANLEMLERADRLAPDERQQAIAEASRETERLARLVADLLALARADAGVQLRRQPVELDRLLMEAIGEARHFLDGQHLAIAGLEPATVVGDPDRLKQLLLVLLHNAVKYTPAGGRISAALRLDNRFAMVTVTDTGIGIAPEDLDRVFERFYRADQARCREPGGTGLGLPIAQWIATQHKGVVNLQSALGSGTTATVRLPLSS